MTGNVKRGNMYFPAKEIVPGLWIGSKGNATSASWVRDHNIKFIVNVSRDIPTPFASSINTYRIPVDDARDENGGIIKHWPITSATPRRSPIVSHHATDNGAQAWRCHALRFYRISTRLHNDCIL